MFSEDLAVRFVRRALGQNLRRRACATPPLASGGPCLCVVQTGRISTSSFCVTSSLPQRRGSEVGDDSRHGVGHDTVRPDNNLPRQLRHPGYSFDSKFVEKVNKGASCGHVLATVLRNRTPTNWWGCLIRIKIARTGARPDKSACRVGGGLLHVRPSKRWMRFKGACSDLAIPQRAHGQRLVTIETRRGLRLARPDKSRHPQRFRGNALADAHSGCRQTIADLWSKLCLRRAPAKTQVAHGCRMYRYSHLPTSSLPWTATQPCLQTRRT